MSAVCAVDVVSAKIEPSSVIAMVAAVGPVDMVEPQVDIDV